MVCYEIILPNPTKIKLGQVVLRFSWDCKKTVWYVDSKLLCAGLSERFVHCPVVSVSQGGYADCDGEYRVTSITLSWDTYHPVYSHITRDRFIFWVGGELGWVIGKQEYLQTGDGDAFHYSKYDNKLS